MTTNRNETPKFGLSREQLDGMFARTTAVLLSDREARQRAEAWPYEMEQALLAAVNRIRELDIRVAALEADSD